MGRSHGGAVYHYNLTASTLSDLYFKGNYGWLSGGALGMVRVCPQPAFPSSAPALARTLTFGRRAFLLPDDACALSVCDARIHFALFPSSSFHYPPSPPFSSPPPHFTLRTSSTALLGQIHTLGVTVTRVVMEENQSDQSGGGIYAEVPLALAVTDSLFSSNTAGTLGGALLLGECESVLLDNVTMFNNTALSGGGLWPMAHTREADGWR